MVFDLNDSTAVGVVKTYLECARKERKTVGLTSGSFDLIHFHHTLYFIRCRRECDVLIVGVDSDKLVRERKGEGRPVVYDSRRVVMVDVLKPVMFAFIMNDMRDFGFAAKMIAPDVIFKSNEFEGREHEVVGKEFSGRIEIIRDVVEHSSTTEILKQAAEIELRKHS